MAINAQRPEKVKRGSRVQKVDFLHASGFGFDGLRYGLKTLQELLRESKCINGANVTSSRTEILVTA